MTVWKHGCDITRILIGYVLSDARIDWLVGNISVYQENLFQSKSKKNPAFSFTCGIIFEKYFIKAIEVFFFRVSIASSKHSGSWENSRQLWKPLTSSRVCITVSNSPNSPSVYMRLWKHRLNVLYCLYITFHTETFENGGFQKL